MKRFASRAFALAAVGFAGIITPAWGQPTVNFDVDGDGRSDVLVSTLTDPAGAAPGHVSIISGLSGQELRVLVGRSASEQFGVGAAVIGDVTGDGVRDVAVAAPGADWESTAPGRVDVFDAVTGDLLYELRGANYLALGWRMAPTRDWNADGVRDIAVWSLVLWSGTLVDGWSLFSGADGTFLGWGLMPERWWERIVDWPPAGVSKPRPRADVDANGRVTFSDLGTLQSVLHTPIEPGDAGDVALDGVLNELDLVEVVLRIGTEEPAWLDRVASAMASQSSTGSLLGHLTAGVPPWSSSGAFGTKKTPHGQMHMDGGVTPGGVLEDDEFEPCGLVVMLEHPDRVTLDQEFEVVPYGSVYLTNDLIDLFGGWGALGLPAGALDSWSLLPDVGVRVRSGFTPGEIAVRAGAGLTGGAMDCPIGGRAVVPVSACPVIALEHAPVYGLGPGQAIAASVAPAGGTLTWEVLAGQDVIAWDPDQAGATFAFEGVGIGPVIVRASYTHPLSQGCVEHAIAAFEVIPGPGDCNGDGISDLCEYQYLGSVNCSVAPFDLPDTDGDGLNDLEECTLGTDPNYFDSDYDGLPDGTEVGVGSNPLVPDGDDDLDGDGLTNFEEHVYGTDPTKADTDGDGVNDATEVGQGSSPNDASDGGVAPSPEELVEVEFVVGDNSGSHSERWQLVVGDIRVTAPGYGELTPPTRFKFRRGRTYEMRMVHLGSKQSPPDMDGEARATIVDDPSGSAFIYDPQSLLRYYDDACNDNGCNPFEGKVAYLCTPFVDLDIDSDNANGLESSQAEEDREEAAGDPGKILLVNDDDDDGDGLPDYADGFGLITGDSALDELYRTTAAEKFVPMSLVVSENIDFEATTITFAYDASDPAAVEVGSDPYMPSLPPGTLRIWTRDGWEERDPRSVADGGHFVPTGIAVPASELPRTLYVEAVAVPEDVAEIVVSLGSVGGVSNPCQDGVAAATDRVRISPVRFGMRRVHADGTTGPLDGVPISTAAPVFSDVQVSVSDLRLSADGKRILGDLVLTGSLDDAVSDLVPGTDGTISEVQVFLNGGSEPIATIPTAISKVAQQDASSPLKPFDFSATFDHVLAATAEADGGTQERFVLQPGMNSVELVATNGFGLAGSVTAAVDIIAIPPEPVLTEVLITVPDYGMADEIHLKVRVGGDVIYDMPLVRDLAHSGPGWRYVEDGGIGVTASALLEIEPWLVQVHDMQDLIDGQVFEIPVVLNRDRLDVFTSVFTVSPAGPIDPAAPLELIGEQAPEPYQSVSMEGFTLDLGLAQVTGLSGPGELLAIAFGVELPRELRSADLAMLLDDISVEGVRPAWLQGSAVSLYGGVFVALPGGDGAFDGELFPDGSPRYGLGQAYAGIAQGLWDAGKGRVVAAGETATTLWHLAQQAAGKAIQYHPVTIVLNFSTGETEVYVEDARRLRALHQQAQVLFELARQIAADGEQFYDALLKGDLPAMLALSSEYQLAIEFALELMEAVDDALVEFQDRFEDMDDFERGRLIGRIGGEIIVEILITASTAGAGHVAKAATVLAAVNKLRSVRYAAPVIDVIEDAVQVYQRLETTSMCFVAGTLVATSAGSQAIETIGVGDLVLSRDPATGVQGYRPVVAAFVTHPDRLYALDFDAGPHGPGSIVGTGEHPFWVVDEAAFVPMRDLNPGDCLLLADGSCAPVLAIAEQPAPPGETFTTYNFEVAEWHTYFAGDVPVWVHNRGGWCQRIAAFVERKAQRDGISKWDAFKDFMERTGERRVRGEIDKHLFDAVGEVMLDAYQRAVRPDGTVDLSVVPSVREIREVMRRRSQGADDFRFWFNAHHTIVLEPGRFQFARVLGIPEDRWDDMPGILMEGWNHRPFKSMDPAIKSFHDVFNGVVGDYVRNGENLRDVEVVLRLHEEAYEQWGGDFGNKVWSVVREWIRHETGR